MQNLRKVLDIFVGEALSGKFDLGRGIYKIEESLLDDPDSIHNDHLVAYRLCRQAAMVVWTGELKKAISRLLKTKDKYYRSDWAEKRVLWAEIDDQEWDAIRKMIRVIRQHHIWIEKGNREVLFSLGSTRQGDWKEMLLDGRLPGREESFFSPLSDTKIYDLAFDL